MKLFTILLIVLSQLKGLNSDDTPYMDDADFKYEIKYSFEKRPQPPKDEFDGDMNRSTYSPSPLPYVKIIITLVGVDSLAERYKVQNNLGATLRNRKVKAENEEFEIDMGFTDDIKDRTGAHEFYIYLVNDNKENLSKIVFHFTEEGNMIVNDKKRGKI